jgi:hypothetical protein
VDKNLPPNEHLANLVFRVEHLLPKIKRLKNCRCVYALTLILEKNKAFGF